MNLKAIFLCILVCFALIPSIQVSASLYDGWTYQINILIEHTKIDAELTDFPIYLEISNSSGITDTDLTPIFDEIGNNYTQLLVTTEDLTSCYTEVVSFDNSTEYAELWIKVPYISNETDTQLRVYFGADHSPNNLYIGVTGSNVAEQVWSSFVMVQHMNDATTSTILDSTSNDNDGTKKAANTPLEVAGKIGNAQQFTTDYIRTTNTLDFTTEITVSLWAKADAIAGYMSLFCYRWNTGNPRVWMYINDADDKYTFQIGTAAGLYAVVFPVVADTNPHYFCGTWKSGDPITLTIDGTTYTGSTQAGNISTASILAIGNMDIYDQNRWNGYIDEVHISNISRSSAWVGASHQTQIDSLLYVGQPSPELAEVNAFTVFSILGFMLGICAIALVVANKKK